MSTDISTPRRIEAADPVAARLWAHAPVLQRRGSQFLGRILIEIWDDGSAGLVESGLISHQVALDALRYLTPLSEAEVKLPALPITGPPGDSHFLGRVIVESWRDRPVVGVFGDDKAGMIEHAMKKLDATIAAQGEG